MKKYRKFSRQYNEAHSENSRFGIRDYSSLYVPFTNKEEGEQFIAELRRHFDIKAELFLKDSGSVTATNNTHRTPTWDITPQCGQAFAVQLLHRLYSKGIDWQDFVHWSLEARTKELQDYLYFMAVRDGRWHNLLYTKSELDWYRDFARLTDRQIAAAVQRSKSTYTVARDKEKRVSFWVGSSLLLLSLLLVALQRQITIWPLLLFTFGIVFFVFGFFRLKQPAGEITR